MRISNVVCALAIGLALWQTAAAQESKKTAKQRKVLSISTEGITFTEYDSSNKATTKSYTCDSNNKKRWSSTMVFDLGFNQMQDNSNYNDPNVKGLLDVPTAMQRKELFDLNFAKSVNVNLSYQHSYLALRSKNQRIYLTTGLGMQIYNFRYDNDISHSRNESRIFADTFDFKKNKLGINYLNVPLLVTFKTRISRNDNPKKDKWLVYGGGITAGYRLKAWSKQKSEEQGKVKMRLSEDFNDFNSCLMGEIGIEGVIKLYGSYQLTSIYDNGLDMKPICIGVRILGI